MDKQDKTAEEQLRRSSFTISVAAENGTQGNVHWRSDECVTLSSALSVTAELEAKIKELEERLQFYADKNQNQ